MLGAVVLTAGGTLTVAQLNVPPFQTLDAWNSAHSAANLGRLRESDPTVSGPCRPALRRHVPAGLQVEPREQPTFRQPHTIMLAIDLDVT